MPVWRHTSVRLPYYTWLFRRKYRESLRRLENYYDEDESKQLRWVKCGFYAALCIGIAASVSVYFPAHFAFYFTVVYIVFTFGSRAVSPIIWQNIVNSYQIYKKDREGIKKQLYITEL